MQIHRIAIPAVFAAAIAVVSPTGAQAYIPCGPIPLTWLFCAADEALDTAVAAIPVPARPVYYPGYQPYQFPPPYTGPAFPPAAPPPR